MRCFHCGGDGYHGPFCEVPGLVRRVEARTIARAVTFIGREQLTAVEELVAAPAADKPAIITKIGTYAEIARALHDGRWRP